MAYAPPSSPQSIGGVVDDGLRLFRASFSRCWLLAIIPGLILAAYEMEFPVTIRPEPSLSYLVSLEAAMRSPRVVGLELMSLLLTLIFQGAVLVREIAIVRGDDSFTLIDALRRSIVRLPGTILATVLFALACLVGFIALIVPGVWLAGRLQLWTAALFIEDASAIEALASSWRLTQDRWWRAAAIFTVAVFIVIVLSVVFAFVGGIIAALSGSSIMESTSVLQLFTVGSGAVAYPLDAAIWLAMYHDFRLRREGGDLAARAQALSGTA